MENINKLDMNSKNIIENNIAKISEIFPNCVIEGKIDFDILKQELSKDILDDNILYKAIETYISRYGVYRCWI